MHTSTDSAEPPFRTFLLGTKPTLTFLNVGEAEWNLKKQTPLEHKMKPEKSRHFLSPRCTTAGSPCEAIVPFIVNMKETWWCL